MRAQSGKVVIAGGNGFIGHSLSLHLLSKGFEVVVLSRKNVGSSRGVRQQVWDARTLGAWRSELEGAAGLVNLVGRTVDCVKTPDHQDEILRSRVEATRVLGHAMRAIERPPAVWAQMSTAHIYGDPPSVRCDEASPLGHGLAPEVGRAWEYEFSQAALPCQRKVILRTSFVIGRDRGSGGGALARLVTLARWGLGGTVGSGRQGMSWLHEVDMNALFERALVDPGMQGVYVASAPNPVPQSEFMRALRRVIRMPIGLPAFAWMVRIGAPLMMRTDPELALYGRYVTSRRLKEEGFQFRFPNLEPALRDLLCPA